MKVAIIGGGLAGAACAYTLRNTGADVTIYEAGAGLASGASGNELGLYNPRISAHRDAVSDYYVAGFSMAVRMFTVLEGIDWNRCGALHLINDEKKERRFPQTLRNWDWDPDHMRIVDAREASEIAGVAVHRDALYLPDAGYVSPHKLCHAYAKGVEVKVNARIDCLSDISADAIIVANSTGVTQFSETAALPIKSVRGQVTMVKEMEHTAGLKRNLCYGGYLTPAHQGIHMLGATFQPWLDHEDVIAGDDDENIEKLGDVLPALAKGLEVVGQRAALRASTKDHFPIVGSVPGHQDLYISAGHGSHGIVSSIVAATHLTDLIMDRPRALPIDVQQALSGTRFL